MLASGSPVTWVMTGDPITQGLFHTHGERNYVDHLHELIRGDLGRVQDVVMNTAISGWRLDAILDDFDRRVSAWRPDVVTVMIGTNDCSTKWPERLVELADFSERIDDFIDRVRLWGAIPVLQTPPYADLAHAPDRARLGSFAQEMRDIAGTRGALLIDQYSFYEEFAAASSFDGDPVPWGLLSDAFHPNAAGHAALALNLAGGLGLVSDGSRVVADLSARVDLARRPRWSSQPSSTHEHPR